MRYFADGRFTEAAFRAGADGRRRRTRGGADPFAPAHWDEALGSSGTVSAVSQLLRQRRPTADHAGRPALVISRCLRAGHVDRLELPGLKDDRRPVIAGGLAMLYTCATHFGIERAAAGQRRAAPGRDLRPRRAPHATARRAGRHDIRDASVRELQRRFMVDAQQAARVAAVAVAPVRAASQPTAEREARRELAVGRRAARDRA